MKKIFFIIISLLISANAFPQTQTQQQNQAQPAANQSRLQAAREGCQKPLGFFPTPSKILCVLTATGQSENEMKPKALAVVFGVCHGYALQPIPAGSTLKKYPTLSACMSDPSAITVINSELGAKGFAPVKVVNPSILSQQPKTAPAL